MGSKQSEMEEVATNDPFTGETHLILSDPSLFSDYIFQDEYKAILDLIQKDAKSLSEIYKDLNYPQTLANDRLTTLLEKKLIVIDHKEPNDQGIPTEYYRTVATSFEFEPLEEYIVHDRDIIAQFTHEKKCEILQVLNKEQMTIMELSKETHMNPGTVKRHLTDLLDAHLVITAFEKYNEKRIRQIYYRNVAKKYILHYEWTVEGN